MESTQIDFDRTSHDLEIGLERFSLDLGLIETKSLDSDNTAIEVERKSIELGNTSGDVEKNLLI